MGSTLIDESNEAQYFLKEAREKIDSIKIFKGETFIGIFDSVLSTNQPDAHGEVLTLDCLNKFDKNYAVDPMWLTVKHNPMKTPIGRVITAKVFFNKTKDIYFVAGIIGTYNSSTFLPPLDHKTSIDVTTFENFNGFKIDLFIDPFVFNQNELKGINDSLPKVVNSNIKRIVNKELSSLTQQIIFGLPTMFFAFLATPPGHIFWDWMVKLLKKLLSGKDSRSILVGFESSIEDCKVELYCKGHQFADLSASNFARSNGFHVAKDIIKAHESLTPKRVVLEYSLIENTWELIFIITKNNRIISNKLNEEDISKYKALSIGGREF